eukprot:UN24288
MCSITRYFIWFKTCSTYEATYDCSDSIKGVIDQGYFECKLNENVFVD